jgi:hypothetical protein
VRSVLRDTRQNTPTWIVGIIAHAVCRQHKISNLHRRQSNHSRTTRQHTHRHKTRQHGTCASQASSRSSRSSRMRSKRDSSGLDMPTLSSSDLLMSYRPARARALCHTQQRPNCLCTHCAHALHHTRHTHSVPFGLAAAMMVVRVCSRVTRPALATEIDCCSIA